MPSPPNRKGWNDNPLERLLLVPGIGGYQRHDHGCDLIIVATSEQVYAAFRQSIWRGLSCRLEGGLAGLRRLADPAPWRPGPYHQRNRSGDPLEIRRAFNPFLESLVASTPYIFAGLAVALGFRAGLFNIGVEGQIFIGAACRVMSVMRSKACRPSSICRWPSGRRHWWRSLGLYSRLV